MGIPAKVLSWMAGRPSGVPGILMNRFGLAALVCSSLAWVMVALVLRASSGDTSKDTHPSTPSLALWAAMSVS